MKKITVREFDKFVAKLTITELLLFKAIIRDWEFHTFSNTIKSDTSDYILKPVYMLTSIESLYYRAEHKLEYYEIRSSLISLHKKGIISKCDYRNKMENKDTFHIKINWDAEIEEAVIINDYIGRI